MKKEVIAQDMTSGNPTGIILRFAVPVLLGNLFQQLYNMVDMVIVGRCLGTEALAAVGSVGTIMFLLIGFIQGVTAGITVSTAQRFGAEDVDGVRRSVGSAAEIALVLSLILTVGSMAVMRSLLTFMRTPEDIFDGAYAYIYVICGGLSAMMAYNLLAAILRALGNSRVPLFFLVLAALLNIVLDLTFIAGLGMGTEGAAYATVLAQGISALLCLAYIAVRVPELHLAGGDLRPRGSLLKSQIAVGLPMGLQYSITAVGSMAVQTSLNLLGSPLVAAYTTANKIDQLICQTPIALGTTMATYNAQNVGAGRMERVRQGFRSVTRIFIIYSLAMGCLSATVGKYLTYLFVAENVTEIVAAVDIALKCSAPLLIPLATVTVYRSGIQGMGYGLQPMMAGVGELAARIVVAAIAASRLSYVGVCLASPLAWVMGSVVVLSLYFHILRQGRKCHCL